MIRRILILCFLSSFFRAPLVSAEWDSLKYPVRSAAYWAQFMAQSFDSRIGRPAPPELLEFLRLDNQANGFSSAPSPPNMGTLPGDLRIAMQEIPEVVREKLKEKLIGVFLVRNLGSSGYTEYTVDEAGRPNAAFVVLDTDYLNKTANAWASWKEATPFRLGKGDNLEVTLEKPKQNDRAHALQYILLHEFGHVLTVGSTLLPLWVSHPQTNPGMAFFNISWTQNRGGHFETIPAWPERKGIAYYAEEHKKRPARDLLPLYRHLQTTAFPSLYAATNPYDDFAESFASYVHVVLMQRPWTIKIKAGSEKFVLNSCWKKPRCKGKRQILDGMLETTP